MPVDNESLPHKRMVSAAEAAAQDLPKLLERICTDPSSELNASPWYFSGLAESIREYMRSESDRTKEAGLTSIGATIEEELDYSLQSGCMVLIEGESGIGKSWAAEAWCRRNPGRARYVRVPSSTDSIAFFRAIAEAMGSAAGLSMKDRQIRERVEDSLQSSKIMLVMDRAQYCWPQFSRNETRPVRINWLVTELVEHGVPIAFISTPQFARNQKLLEERTGWTSAEFVGRIARHRKLSAILPMDDIKTVARHWLPAGDRKSIEAVALFAKASPNSLAAIAPIVERAKFLARKDGEPLGFKYIAEAIAENVPSLKEPVQAEHARKDFNSLSPDRGGLGLSAANRINEPITEEA